MGRKIVIQQHHVSYEPEVKVTVYKGEHMILTRLSWRKRVSKGFIVALKKWIEENEATATELGET